MQSDKDPIVAMATAAGRGAIGIIRLSFDPVWNDSILRALLGERKVLPRHAHLYPITDDSGQVLDRAIVLFFPAPASYTGESVLEIQIHGGPVLLQMVMRTVLEKCRFSGMRPARAGEFTERAFLNGRMDLAQAEAVTDLIEAASESAAQAAQRSLAGEFSQTVRSAGEGLDEVRAYIEAVLDFPEEELDPSVFADLSQRVEAVRTALSRLIRNAGQGKILREGIAVALVGSPNVGKSSLLNALAGEDVAIVTDIAGTTRDRVEHWVNVNGVPLRMVDTAGLRETDDIVEQKGIERTLEAMSKAEIILHLVDATGSVSDDEAVLETVRRHVRQDASVLCVANKCDLLKAGETIRPEALAISVKTGEGLPKLREELLRLAGMNTNTEGLFIARERHLAALERAREHTDWAVSRMQAGEGWELVAEELRLAGDALGEVLGKTLPDDLLGRIFSQFCIGK